MHCNCREPVSREEALNEIASFFERESRLGRRVKFHGMVDTRVRDEDWECCPAHPDSSSCPMSGCRHCSEHAVDETDQCATWCGACGPTCEHDDNSLTCLECYVSNALVARAVSDFGTLTDLRSIVDAAIAEHGADAPVAMVCHDMGQRPTLQPAPLRHSGHGWVRTTEPGRQPERVLEVLTLTGGTR